MKAFRRRLSKFCHISNQELAEFIEPVENAIAGNEQDFVDIYNEWEKHLETIEDISKEIGRLQRKTRSPEETEALREATCALGRAMAKKRTMSDELKVLKTDTQSLRNGLASEIFNWTERDVCSGNAFLRTW